MIFFNSSLVFVFFFFFLFLVTWLIFKLNILTHFYRKLNSSFQTAILAWWGKRILSLTFSNVFLFPSVRWGYFFIAWFINVNIYMCVWYCKSFAVELTIAYTWRGSSILLRDGKNNIHLMGAVEESTLWSYEKEACFERVLVAGNYHMCSSP